jgi:hypothetical protein
MSTYRYSNSCPSQQQDDKHLDASGSAPVEGTFVVAQVLPSLTIQTGRSSFVVGTATAALLIRCKQGVKQVVDKGILGSLLLACVAT